MPIIKGYYGFSKNRKTALQVECTVGYLAEIGIPDYILKVHIDKDGKVNRIRFGIEYL